MSSCRKVLMDIDGVKRLPLLALFIPCNIFSSDGSKIVVGKSMFAVGF